MRIHAVPAAKGSYYPCSKSDIRQHFEENELAWAALGAFRRRFEFDRRCTKRPKLSGDVVATLTFAPTGEAYLSIFSVREAEYSQDCRKVFGERILPQMRVWLQQKQAVETGPSSHQELIVEWTAGEHRFHEVKFLYATT